MATTTKEYLIKTVYDSTGIRQFTSDVEKAKTVGTQLGLSLTNSAKVIDQNVTTSINKAGQTVRNVTTIFEQHGKKSKVAFQEVGGVVNDAGNKLKNFGSAAGKANIDLGQLISRAAITIPVWIALRAAITGVFQGITGGVQNLVSFDQALQKVRRNLQGTPEEVEANFNTMKKEITDFSLKTGIAVEEISESIKNFATIGFNFRDSMTGGLEATRLASLLFGDASDTANAFASALRVLVKEGKDQVPIQQQMSEAMALTAELAKENKDDIGELTQGLSKFAATAKTSNLSMKETITLLLTLATAGRSGAVSGTLLSTTFNKLLTNLDEVSKRFGIQFNPAVDSGINVLTKLLDAAKEMAKTPTGQLQVIEKLADVLGGERGTKMVTSLLAVNDILKKNLGTMADTNKFHSDFDKLLETDFKQAEILTNSLKEMGKSFVTSLVGANNFNEALKTINQTVNTLKPGLEALAGIIGRGFREGLRNFIPFNYLKVAIEDAIDKLDKASQAKFEKMNKGLAGKLSKIELDQLVLDIKEDKITLPKTLNKDVLLDALSKALSLEEVSANLKTDVKVGVTPEIDSSPEAIASMENDLAELKARLKAKGATDLQLSLLDVDFLKSKAIQDADKIRDSQSKIRVQTVEKERAIQDLLLQAVEDGAKAQGASNLEALARRIELEKQLGIEKTGMELLKQQLDLQKALTEETKKTKEERLKDLAEAIKKTPSAFASSQQGANLDFQEARLRNQAAFKGLSDEQVNKILNPEAKATGILKDLQVGVTDPMTNSMGSLEGAISSLTQTILQQEIRPLGVGVPGPAKALNSPSVAGANAVALSLPTPQASITNVYDMGGIKVTVTGETNAEVLEEMARMFKDAVAVELLKPGTKINLASRQVIRQE